MSVPERAAVSTGSAPCPGIAPVWDSQDGGLRLLAAALARVAQEQSVRKPRVIDVFDAYLLAQERGGRLAEGTLDVIRQARRHLAPLLGDERDLSGPLVEALLDGLLDAGLRSSTARSRLAKLRAAWSWALARGIVSQPWCPPPRRRRRPSPTKRAMTVPELAQVLCALQEPYRLPAQVLVESGARPAEVLGADVCDLERIEGGDWLVIQTGKSGGLTREVPLLPATAEALRASAPRRGAMFRGVKGKRLQVRQLAKKVCDAAPFRRRVASSSRGASYDVDQYSFRRSLIDHAARCAVDEVVTRVLVGHSIQGVHHGYRRGSVTREQLREAVVRVAAWRSAQLAPQAQAPQEAPSRRWTRSALCGKGLPGSGLAPVESESLAGLADTTRTLPGDYAQALATLNARMAVKRAAVRVSGYRGFLVDACAEVFSAL